MSNIPLSRLVELKTIAEDSNGRKDFQSAAVGNFGLLVNEVMGLRRDLNAANKELERLDSWEGLMWILDRRWPATIFPTLEDDPKRDAGARIVSLIRWVNQLREYERIFRDLVLEAAKQMQAEDAAVGKAAPAQITAPDDRS